MSCRWNFPFDDSICMMVNGACEAINTVDTDDQVEETRVHMCTQMRVTASQCVCLFVTQRYKAIGPIGQRFYSIFFRHISFNPHVFCFYFFSFSYYVNYCHNSQPKMNEKDTYYICNNPASTIKALNQ